jgi:hypothetical protein
MEGAAEMAVTVNDKNNEKWQNGGNDEKWQNGGNDEGSSR